MSEKYLNPMNEQEKPRYGQLEFLDENFRFR